jgi:Ca2+-binding RTX toxin-like protein
LAGDDTLFAGTGNDLLLGGDGNDVLVLNIDGVV